MFTSCGNPACGAPFGNSESGRIFVSDSATGLGSTCMVQVELATGLRPVYFFWLCDACCRLTSFDVAAGTPDWEHLLSGASRPSAGFARRLVAEDRTLIESRCEQCGWIIVGSVMDGLEETEAQHRAKCTRAARTADPRRD